MADLEGSFYVFILFDVAEQIDLARLRKVLGVEPPRREPASRNPAPGDVTFERPPVVEHPGDVVHGTGETFRTCVKYFDYGIVSVQLELPFSTDWQGLVNLSSRWVAAPEMKQLALKAVRDSIVRVKPALIQPYADWLSEDYCVVQLGKALDKSGNTLNTLQLIEAHGNQIAQIVRGEPEVLSESERQETLHAGLSYYPTDLVVAGWAAAFIYDKPVAAEPILQLLEYANTQLLEFRHYDRVLTRELSDVYKLLEGRAGFFGRWRTARRAERLSAIRLDIAELTERMDTVIKFLSDMFYSRVYHVAATRIGVPDYRNIVEEKLKTAGELYNLMINEFHQARTFVLEVMVVAILVIELVHLFRGGW